MSPGGPYEGSCVLVNKRKRDEKKPAEAGKRRIHDEETPGVMKRKRERQTESRQKRTVKKKRILSAKRISAQYPLGIRAGE